MLARSLRNLARACMRPLGFLAFVMALWTLSAAARLLGNEHELGFFASRLNSTIWHYPEVTRRGVQIAWLLWGALFAVAVSPYDPLATWWDEVVLGAAALGVVWRRMLAERRAAR